jgi:hypothetical protein
LKCEPIELIKTNDISDYYLRFLRPAPVKMSIRPIKVKEYLFSRYESMPPPIENNYKLVRKLKKIKNVFYDENDENATDQIDIDDADLEWQMIVEKCLNRRYHSETDLSLIIDRNEKQNDNYIFKRPTLVRTLSDSLIKRKFNNNKIDDKFNFTKIDSNYNDALAEVIFLFIQFKFYILVNLIFNLKTAVQKELIKADFNNQKNKKVQETKKIETIDLDNEIKRIEEIKDKPVTSTIIKKEYFPKNINKKTTLAEEALKAGRKYIIYPFKKDKKVSPKNTFNFDQLDKIELQIYNENIIHLKRSMSTDNLKFNNKKYWRFDEALPFRSAQSARIKATNRSSQPNLFDFNLFKTRFHYDESKWFENNDTYYNNEREWSREIWNDWFDEVIPQFNGELKIPSRLVKREERDRLERALKTNLSGKSSIMYKEEEEEDINEDSEKEEEEEKDKLNDENDDDDNSSNGNKRITKSPTPYETYSTIDFTKIGILNNETDESVDMNTKNLEKMKIIENEIEHLSDRLEEGANVFDFARRGTLFRKVFKCFIILFSY